MMTPRSPNRWANVVLIVVAAITLIVTPLVVISLASSSDAKGKATTTNDLLSTTACRAAYRVPIDETTSKLAAATKTLNDARDAKLDLFLNGLFDSVVGNELNPDALTKARATLDLTITAKEQDVKDQTDANNQAIAMNKILVQAGIHDPELFAHMCKHLPI